MLVRLGESWALFQDFTVTEGNNGVALGRPEQLKPHLGTASLAARKNVVLSQRRFMHKPVGIVKHPIDRAADDPLARPKLSHLSAPTNKLSWNFPAGKALSRDEPHVSASQMPEP